MNEAAVIATQPDRPVLAPATVDGLPLPDAYVEWALQTGFRDVGGLGPGGWLSVMLELKEPARDFALRISSTPALAGSIHVAAHYASPALRLEPSKFCTASISERFLLALLGKAGPSAPEVDAAIEKIYRFEIGFASARPADAAARALPKLAADERRAKVIVGVIDDGLAFANQRFCRVQGDRVTTRMACFWNQDDAHAAASAWGYGHEHDAAALNGCIDASTRGGRVHEDEVYARAHYRGMNRRATHGTHVMDLACGMAPEDVTDDTPLLIGVQLPGAAIDDTSCGSLGVHMLDALRYILKRADELGSDDCQVIVNLSYGSIAGPHDGSSIFESAVYELIGLRSAARFRLVMPAGNSHLARCHWWCDLPPQAATMLPWRVLPDDGTPSFLEIWFDSQAARVDVVVESPRGDLVRAVPLGPGSQCLPGSHGPQCVVTHRDDVSNGAGVMVLVVIAPTVAIDAACTTASAGTWKVHIANLGSQTTLNAWIQRDDVAYGRKGKGRQSYLLEDGYQRFNTHGGPQLKDGDTFTRRLGTLNGMATSGRTDIVGGICLLDAGRAMPAPYSAPGLPLPRGQRAVPQAMLLAISEDSPVRHGVLATGTHTGSMVALSGTSMAAPQYVRELAGLSQPPAYAVGAPSLVTPQRIADFAGVPRRVVAASSDLAARCLRRRPR